MLLFVALAALWGIASFRGVSLKRRIFVAAPILLALNVALLVLPRDHELIAAVGNWSRSLAIVLCLGVAFAAVNALLTKMRAVAKSKAPEPAARSNSFSEIELERYARHIVLREIGGAGQKRLKNAKILVIGAGGLGAPVLQYLAAAGVGTIGVIDDDAVENSNLQRQVIHTESRIGIPKVHSAKDVLLAQNPHIEVLTYNRRFVAEIAADLVADFDIVIDGCDNFETRYLVNKTCVDLGVPLVSGALSQWEGQLTVFDPKNGTPCYQCVFPEKPAAGLAPNCAEAGVFASLPGVVGAMMAGEAMKLVIGGAPTLLGEMLIYDAMYANSRKIKMKARNNCPICTVHRSNA